MKTLFSAGRALSLAAACVMGTAAFAASSSTSAPVDLDSPDTAVDSAEAQAERAAFDDQYVRAQTGVGAAGAAAH